MIKISSQLLRTVPETLVSLCISFHLLAVISTWCDADRCGVILYFKMYIMFVDLLPHGKAHVYVCIIPVTFFVQSYSHTPFAILTAVCVFDIYGYKVSCRIFVKRWTQRHQNSDRIFCAQNIVSPWLLYHFRLTA